MTQSATTPGADDAVRVVPTEVAGATRAMFLASASAMPMLRGPMVTYAPEDDGGADAGGEAGEGEAVEAADDEAYADDGVDQVELDEDGNPVETAEDLEDFEVEGKTHKIPASVRRAIAGYASQIEGYTSARRSFEAQQAAHQQQVELNQEILSETVKFTALNEAVEYYKKLDWSALQGSNPEQAQKLWMEYQQANIRLDDAAKSLDGKKAELQKAAVEQETARIAEVEAALAREIPGWGKQLFEDLVGFAEKQGIPQTRLRQADIGEWKLLHLASIGAKAQQQQQRVAQHKKTQETRPAAPTKGTGAVRDLNSVKNTEEWMRRRNAQVAKRA